MPDAACPIELRGVSCSREGGGSVRGISARFSTGRMHVLTGAEKGGRELLLRVIGLLETPDAGEVLVDGNPTCALDEEARAQLRARRFGFVFAAPFLLGSFSVIENVAMPLFKVSHVSPEEARTRTDALLDFVDMGDAAEEAIGDLSSRAQYHVALARGLANEPSVLVVENLDGTLAGDELDGFATLLRRVSIELHTAVVATASPDFIAAEADRVLALADGAVARDSDHPPHPEA